MKEKFLPCLLLLSIFYIKSTAQESTTSAAGYSTIFLYYPLEKSGTPYTLFLNKKNIGKITNGGRMECKLILEGPVAITLIEGYGYREPLTQSKNSRTISISKGKSYYFRVTGSGALEYILNTEKGQNRYMEAKEFISQPASFIEAPGAGIPPLQSSTN